MINDSLNYLGKKFKNKQSLSNFKKYVMPKLISSIYKFYKSDPVIEEVFGSFEEFKRYELRRFSQWNSLGLKYKVGVLVYSKNGDEKSP